MFLRYFCVLPFFTGNFALYAIGFVLACVIIVTYTTLLVYSIVSLNRSTSLSFYGHSALRLITRISTYIFNVFYLPLLNMLLSIYNCDATTGMNVHSSDNDSNGGNAIYKGDATYIAFCVLSAVFTVVLTAEKYMYTILCYEHIYNRNNIISKQTSEPERIVMVIQVFVVFMNEIWKNELLFIVCYMLLTLLLLCKYKASMHLYNYTMSKLNMCYAMMLACNAVSFFIARISYNTHFNGNIMLFVISIIIGVIALLCFYEDDYSIVTINTRSEHVNDAKRGYIAIAKINDVIRQVNKNKRKERMILESYIHSYELTCTIKNCPLTRYGNELAKGNFNVQSLLYQHIDVRYKQLLEKFPNNAYIKLMYCYHLYKEMGLVNMAKKTLHEAKEDNTSIEEEFLIYRLSQILDKEGYAFHTTSALSSSHTTNTKDEDNITYTALYNCFINYIKRISSLYTKFWSTLFLSHQDRRIDLSQLNDCGSEISKLKCSIEKVYSQLNQIKPNDVHVMKYYADFLGMIINDNKSAKRFYYKIREIQLENANDYEKDIIDINIRAISSDEIQFIIVSTHQHDIGCIIDISLGLCADSGYTKNELVNHSCNMLIPDLIRSFHMDVMRKRLNEFKQSVIDDKLSKKQYVNHFSFFINKAHFLIPAVFSPAIISNDNNDMYFITRVMRDHHIVAQQQSLMNNANALFINDADKERSCFVITNPRFIIREYSIEALRLLALNQSEDDMLYMGNFIVDFKANRFRCKTQQEMNVVWVKKNKSANINNEFYLTKTPLVIDGKHVGYVFKFTLKSGESKVNNKWKKSNDITGGFVPMIEEHKTFVYNTKNNSYMRKGRTNMSNTVNNGDSSNNSVSVNMSEEIKRQAYEKLKGINITNLNGIAQEEDEEDEDDDDDDSNNNSDDDDDNTYTSYTHSNTSSNEDDSNYVGGGANTHNNTPMFNSNSNTNNTNNKRSVSVTNFTNEQRHHSHAHAHAHKRNDDINSTFICLPEMIAANIKFNDEKRKANDISLLTEMYFVNLKNIKLYIYDFDNNRINENNEPANYQNYIQHRINELSNPSTPFTTKKSNVKKVKKEETAVSSFQKEQNEKEVKIIKQIQYSLNKYEAQVSMRKLQLSSILVILLLIIEGVLGIIIYTSVYTNIEQNCSLIHYSFTLLTNCVYSIFFTRELTLINHEQYEVMFQNLNDYINDTLTHLSDLTSDSEEKTNFILTSSAEISDETAFTLFNETLQLYMISDNLNILSFNVTLNAALSQTLSSVFVLLYSEPTKLLPTAKAVYFSLLNNMNGLYNGLIRQANLFKKEMSRSNSKNTTLMVVFVVCCFVIGVCSYVLLYMLYVHVVSKKDEYLKVFNEIGLNVIRVALEHCERFTQQLNTVDNDEYANGFNVVTENANNNNNDNNSDTQHSFDFERELMLMNSDNNNNSSSTGVNGHLQRTRSNDDYNTRNSSDGIERHSRRNSQNAKHLQYNTHRVIHSCTYLIHIKLFLSVECFLSTVISIALVVLTHNAFMHFERNIAVFTASSEIHAKYLMLFNVLREYIFDKDIYVDYKWLPYFFNDELAAIYDNTRSSNMIINQHLNHLSKPFQELYDKYYYHDICEGNDYLKGITDTTITCDSLTASTAKYGLSVLLPFFVEEIKEVKLKFEANEKETQQRNCTFNFTLYGLGTMIEDQSRNCADQPQLNPFNYLINKQHDRLVLVFRRLFEPVFQEISRSLTETNVKNQQTQRQINMIVLITYLCVVCVGYLFVWKRIENKVYATIFKAKNMLMILPKEILVGLDSVHKLFGINVDKLEEEDNEDDDVGGNGGGSGSSGGSMHYVHNPRRHEMSDKDLSGFVDDQMDD